MHWALWGNAPFARLEDEAPLLLLVLNVRFVPKATELLRRREMTQRAKSSHRTGIARQASSGSISSTNHTTRLLFASYR
jgi:hypothetical protein